MNHFSIETIFLGEYDKKAGPSLRYVKNKNDSEAFRKFLNESFRENNDFLIPGKHLCDRFVCLFLGNGLTMMSYAIEYIKDKYKRGKIEFDIGWVLFVT